MTFPSSDLCITLPAIPELSRVCLPGGICLDYTWSGLGQSPASADMALQFIGQLGPAMAPLQPFFNILNTVVQIFKCVQAIPDAITSLNPSGLIDCVPALAELVDQLLSMIPQISLPKMVIATVKNVATFLQGVATELRSNLDSMNRINEAIDRAALLDDVQMSGFLVCAQGTVQKSVEATAMALQGIGQFIMLINTCMSLFGGPEIPCFGSLVDGDTAELDATVALLESMAEMLLGIVGLIPDPDMARSLALGDVQC